MEFATLSDSVLGFFTVHHKLKWSVNERGLFGMPKKGCLEPIIKMAPKSTIGRDFKESHPNIEPKKTTSKK